MTLLIPQPMRVRRWRPTRALIGAICIGVSAAAGAASASGTARRQSLDEAWWTGPLLAPSAATLPRGHWLVEPYVYDVMTYGRLDREGALRSAGAAHVIGSQSYIEYGLRDRLTLGVIPRFGLHESRAGEGSSGLEVGDLTLQGAYGLTRFRPGSWMPAISLVIGETVPTGRYDRLGERPSGALGSGAWSTTVSLYSQTYLWMPNGRLLRMRLDVSYAMSQWATVHGVSVYGTPAGFRGRAHPGPSVVGDVAFEYSVTQKWVLATDFNWEHDETTRVTSALPTSPPRSSGAADLLYLAPAIEYNWSATMGVIAGARIVAVGRNVMATATPVAALNMVF